MKKIIVDDDLRRQLRSTRIPVELCDPNGEVLGTFRPQLTEEQKQRMEPKISEEEIQRRLDAGGGRELKDILDDLENRS